MSGSHSNSINSSNSSGDAATLLWGPQGNALQNLYGAAEDQYGAGTGFTNQAATQVPGITQNMQDLYGASSAGQENLLSGGSVGDTSEIRNMLLGSLNSTMNSPSNTSQMYQSIVGGAGNSYIDPVVDAMKDSAMDNYSRMTNANTLDSRGNLAPTSRAAMKDAMLGAEMDRNLQATEANLRSGAYDKDLAMKMNIANLADQNIQGSQDRLAGLLGQADKNVSSGMGYSPTMMNLGMGQLAPFAQLAGMDFY